MTDENKIFEELETSNIDDPKIIIQNEKIIFKTNLFYLSFILNFVYLAILIVIVAKGNLDVLYIMVTLVLIGFLVYFILNELSNSVKTTFDLKKQKVTIEKFYGLWFPQKMELDFANIRNINLRSNFWNGGFWSIHRRYYIYFKHPQVNKELVLVNSGDEKAAVLILDKIKLLLQII